MEAEDRNDTEALQQSTGTEFAAFVG